MTLDLSFDAAAVVVAPISGGPACLVELAGCFQAGAPGEPLLPARSLALVLPAGASNVCFGVSPVSAREIGRGITVGPAGSLAPIGAAPDPWSGGAGECSRYDELVYGSLEPYPGDLLIASHVGNCGGFTIASLVVQPWIYLPASGDLSLCERLTVTVDWREGHAPALTEHQVELGSTLIRSWIDNPGDLDRFAPVPLPSGSSRAPVDYLVVCDSAFASALVPLALFHEQQGMASEIVTIQEIVESSPGRDDAEKLRSYLAGRFLSDGLRYALLAGDEKVLPVRYVHTECDGWVDTAPAELYFCDLDGDWDASGDGVFGQPEDSIDFYSDISVGRALFSTLEDCETFVAKTLGYSSSPAPGSWRQTAVLCGSMLFAEIGYHAGKVNDSIAVALPAGWEIVKSYETAEDTDGSDTHISYISDGSGWNHYGGHGNNRGIYWHTAPHSMMTNWIADTLTNGERSGIHLSIACSPGAFHDSICCAEALLHNPDGGAAAVMFNTTFGWEGFWPEMGVSEWLCILTTRQVFRNHAPTLGDAFTSARDQRVPLMHGGADRTFQVMMSWALFGDPALQVLGVAPDAPIPPAALRMDPPWPNPAGRDAPISFFVDFSNTPFGCETEISVLDLAGRLLWRTSIQNPCAVRWEGVMPGGRRVPAGVYLLTARRGDVVVGRLVTILD
ncbi:hypothetical protein JW921_01825 [Candidatus Fermentibacterales bacterium]|nr:hypothetical protein [Candidatus Fermentibacterales bacterium]